MGMMKLTLGIFLLGVVLQGGWGQNITFSFFNPDILAVPIMGKVQLDSFSGNSGCMQIESPFALRDDATEERDNIIINLDCICMFETEFCSGRAQRLLSDENGFGSSRRTRLAFNPNSLMRCSDVGGLRVNPTSGRPLGSGRFTNRLPTRPRPSRPRIRPLNNRRPLRPRPNEVDDEDPQDENVGNVPRDVFEQAALDGHNQFRSDHGAPDLQLDDNLSDDAQRYAQLLADSNSFDHSNEPSVGENLFQGPARDEEDAVNQAVQSWYAEEALYDYERPGFSDETGHFTQLIWEDSRNLGIGVAYSEAQGTWKVVARYSPQGNFGGARDYERNVQRLI